MDTTAMMRMNTDVPESKRGQFMMMYDQKAKDPTTALLFCFFLGGVGGHKFYMGKTGVGLVYLLFCLTFIPTIIAFFELFFIQKEAREYNEKMYMETLTMLGLSMGGNSSTVAIVR